MQRLTKALNEGSKNHLNELSIEEVNTSIASYHHRLDESNALLEQKTQILSQANKKIDFLSTELRKVREERSISTRR